MRGNKTHALVVLSGGQDSTTCLFWAKEHFEKVSALTFAYGQRHEVEIQFARAAAERAGADFTLLNMPLIGSLTRNSLTSAEMAMDAEKPEGGLPNTFVPGRNLFFLSVAAVVARERGISDIVTGVSQTDFSGYPDCRADFIRSLNVTLNLAMEVQLTIHTPLMWLDKAETWALAQSLGQFDYIRHHTLTCYKGIAGDGCGECPACKLRRRGLEEFLATNEHGPSDTEH